MSYKPKQPPPGSLFAMTPPSHHNAPETSKQAADRIAPTAASLRAKVFDAIATSPDGLTDDEVQVLLEMPAHTQTARRWELVKLGHVVKSDRRRTTRTGASAVVWIAVKA